MAVETEQRGAIEIMLVSGVRVRADSSISEAASKWVLSALNFESDGMITPGPGVRVHLAIILRCSLAARTLTEHPSKRSCRWSLQLNDVFKDKNSQSSSTQPHNWINRWIKCENSD